MKKYIFILIIFVSFISSANSELNYYWDHIPYWDMAPKNIWYEVPASNGEMFNSSASKEHLKKQKEIIKSADYIGVILPKFFRKVECDDSFESDDCAEYFAVIKKTIKGDKNSNNAAITFIDFLPDAPLVYGEDTLYLLYENDGKFSPDLFIYLPGTEKWVKVIEQLLSCDDTILNSK